MCESKYIIVIHCTHGVNRSAYMVVRYLIDRLGYKPEHAIDLVTTVSHRYEAEGPYYSEMPN